MFLADAFNTLYNVMDFAPDNPNKYSNVQSFVDVLAYFFVGVAGSLSVVAIAFGFLQIATSTGDPKNTERAQRALIWGAFGLVISIIIWVLKLVLFNAVGISGVN
jgi:hypothetical protein